MHKLINYFADKGEMLGIISTKTDSKDVLLKKLKKQKVIEKGKFFRHIRFDKPLLIRMDGKKGMAVISMNN